MAADSRPLVPVTAIMTIRLDCPERLVNATLTTKHLLDHLHFQQVLMVEADTSPKLLGSIVHPRLRWLYIQTDPAEPGFHKSQAINAALPWVETATCVIWDCDGLVSDKAVAHSVSAMTNGLYDQIVPYSRLIFLKQYSAYGLEALAGKWPTNPIDHAHMICENASGLITFLSTKYFRHIRGMSETFRTYGDEDNELTARVQRLGGRQGLFPGDALHLWHPSLRKELPEAKIEEQAKQQEIQRLLLFTARDMRTYLGITELPGEFIRKRQFDAINIDPLNCNVVIFSLDRAAQLDLLLTSMELHFAGIEHITITIIWRATEQIFRDGYERVKALHPRFFIFREQKNFREDLLATATTDSALSMFLVDDDVFIRPFSLNMPQCREILSDSDIYCLSLNLNPKVNYCYVGKHPAPPPTFMPGLRFAWKGQPGGWGWPISFDGQLFRTVDILPTLQTAPYTDPNTLERELAARWGSRPLALCFSESKLVNVPMNRVQSLYAGPNMGVATVGLNTRFLEGYRLDVKSVMKHVQEQTTHQEIDVDTYLDSKNISARR